MWVLEPQIDNNGKEVGIGGLSVSWLLEKDNANRVKFYPGTRKEVRVLVDSAHGEVMVRYLNGDYGQLISVLASLEERQQQPYLDMERVPRA